MEFMAN